MSIDDRGRRLTPEALHALMERADISTESFALVSGTARNTVVDWRRGKRDIPIWVHPFLEMMTVDRARQLAERTVDEARFRARESGVAA